MNRSVQKDWIRDGAVITFLAALLIAVLAFQVCLNTKPGQFLPKELTQRENVTGAYIIQGIEDASAKAFAIRDSLSGNGKMTAGECWTAFANDSPLLMIPLAFSRNLDDLFIHNTLLVDHYEFFVSLDH